MRTFEVVTTFSRQGYWDYGKTMLRSFARHWPGDVEPHVYAEGFGRMLPAWQAEFAERAPAAARGAGRGGYNFRFDAVKFSHKVAAIIDGYEKCVSDVMIWLDADTVTHAPVTIEFLDGLMPGEAQVAWLDRERLYPECGFVMYRARDPQLRALMAEWRQLHATGELFELAEWHDSWVFEHLVKKNGIRAHSLSGPEARKTSHPFVNSVLGSRLDHLKGPRKKLGQSKPSDLVTKRNEAYWR